MSPLAERILAKVKDFGNVSFAELEQIEGFSGGDYQIGLADRNLILWEGLSKEGVDALNELRGMIEPKPTSLHVYLADGMMMNYPIAKTAGPYKEPRWAPVVFNVRSQPISDA